MKRVREQMATHDVAIELTDEAKELLVEKGYDPAMGARPLRRAIQRVIEDPLADFVLGRSLEPGSTILVARKGETICIVGESGTGKSTTLKLILRLLVPDRGQVNIDGQDITNLTFEEALQVRQRMGMVFQGAALFDSMTVFENVAYPLREHTKLADDEIEQRVREKLEFVDLDPDQVIDQLPSQLSGGMRKRVGIARGMANNPEIMLYDEPTSGLDPLTTGTITRLIKKLQRELDVTSVVVSHDIRSVFNMATKVAVLNERRIAFFGTPEEMAGSDDPYIRDFLGGS